MNLTLPIYGLGQYYTLASCSPKELITGFHKALQSPGHIEQVGHEMELIRAISKYLSLVEMPFLSCEESESIQLGR